MREHPGWFAVDVHDVATQSFQKHAAAYASGADYVLLLNNDMEVEAAFLEPAVAAAEHDRKIGLVTGKILFGDRRDIIWQAGGRIDAVRIQGSPRGWNEPDQGQYDNEGETHWASGAMFLMLSSTLGIRPSAPRKELNIVNPQLPDWLDHLHIRNLRVGNSRVGLDFTRRGERTFCNVVDVDGDKLAVNVAFRK